MQPVTPVQLFSREWAQETAPRRTAADSYQAWLERHREQQKNKQPCEDEEETQEDEEAEQARSPQPPEQKQVTSPPPFPQSAIHFTACPTSRLQNRVLGQLTRVRPTVVCVMTTSRRHSAEWP